MRKDTPSHNENNADGTDNSAGSKVPALKFITIAEACEIAHIKRWKLAEWLKLKDENGKLRIRSFKIGSSKNGRVRIDEASFKAFIESKIRQGEDGKEVEK